MRHCDARARVRQEAVRCTTSAGQCDLSVVVYIHQTEFVFASDCCHLLGRRYEANNDTGNKPDHSTVKEGGGCHKDEERSDTNRARGSSSDTNRAQ